VSYVLRRVGFGAFIAYLLIPEGVLFVLLGIATSWRLAGLIAAGMFACLVAVYAGSRSRGLIGRTFGTAGWDPLDYSQWTRHLVVRSLVTSLPISLALIVATLIIAPYELSLAATIAIYAASTLVGVAFAGWLWAWRAGERKPSEAAGNQEDRRG
jgi:hypothetical protein